MASGGPGVPKPHRSAEVITGCVVTVPGFGRFECRPIRKKDGVAGYTYPGGRVYSLEELHELARNHGTRLEVTRL